MKKLCFILASSDDRIYLLNQCVRCAKNSRYANYDFYLYHQGNGNGIEDPEFFREIVWDDSLRGVFTPRYELMKRFCLQYDYTVLIDDDLFLKPDTSYENAVRFCEIEPRAGAVALTHSKPSVKNEIRCVSGSSEYFNVCGGLVLPQKSIKIILEYFADKEQDYTEDVVWLLLYVKGYDLYKDYTSCSQHTANRKVSGKLSGYNKMRVEKPHVPMLSEWFDSKQEFSSVLGKEVWKLKEMTDINENGKKERLKCI